MDESDETWVEEARVVLPIAGEPVRYQIYGWWKGLLVYLLVLFGVVGFAFAANLGESSASEIVFFVVWCCGWIYALRLYTYGVASSVTVLGETLTWHAPRRTRTVAVADLVGVGMYGLDTTGVVAVLELADGTKLPVMVRKGFADLVAHLAQRRPGIPIVVGRYSRVCERLQRRSGFSRGTRP